MKREVTSTSRSHAELPRSSAKDPKPSRSLSFRGLLRGLLRGSSVTALALGALSLGLLLPMLSPSPARADATVEVRVLRGHQPVEATVTLTLSDGGSRTCRTRNGSCRMQVPGGDHVVRAQPREEGRPSPDRRVTVPPAGQVTLVVHVP